MDKDEVTFRLTEHLKAKQRQNGELNNRDKQYCIRYVMDFLLVTRKDAKQFIADHLPALAGVK